MYQARPSPAQSQNTLRIERIAGSSVWEWYMETRQPDKGIALGKIKSRQIAWEKAGALRTVPLFYLEYLSKYNDSGEACLAPTPEPSCINKLFLGAINRTRIERTPG
jgi:hypothetical protein